MGTIYKKVEYSRITQLRFEHQRVWMLRKMYTVYWNMKLKRLARRKLNQKLLGTESVVGNLAQEDQLLQGCWVLRKGKQCSIFLDLPSSPCHRVLLILSSEFSGKRDRRPSLFPYPIVTNEENSSHPGQKTWRMDRRVKSVCAHPAGLLLKSILMNVGHDLSFLLNNQCVFLVWIFAR